MRVEIKLYGASAELVEALRKAPVIKELGAKIIVRKYKRKKRRKK